MSEKENSQMQNLMAYTVFHIGVYISILGVILGAQIADSINYSFFKVPFAFLLIAGLCGGVIASNIPETDDFDTFKEKKIGPWGMELFKYRVWATVEHVTFWFAVLYIALPALFCDGKPYMQDKPAHKSDTVCNCSHSKQ
ncbi:MAG: hypothetical protein K0Q79_2568 [Flavipsychrobacter sp.]|jgi:hypothetical protein|nr:hypothetical protein [Flavipsychrobacter sp.]